MACKAPPRPMINGEFIYIHVYTIHILYIHDRYDIYDYIYKFACSLYKICKNTQIHVSVTRKFGTEKVDVWCRQEDMQQRGPMPDVATLGAAAFGKERISWWWLWFQISLIFTPIWGRFPNWLIFSGGLKPPTRFSCIPKESIEHLFSF